MTRIAKLVCFAALVALTLVLALAEPPVAEAHPHCSIEETTACNNYCMDRGCQGVCTQQYGCTCECTIPPNDRVN